ncbi:hypothetical protein GGR54DRAFT_608227 [Hypoxylon sp. NC1633]|nr:hypothetical protein GGR54DRAFT_608227 [Hypoxylon sp. NC1633]
MLRRSLRSTLLRGSKACSIPAPVARVGLVRPYSEQFMSNSQMRSNGDKQTTRYNRSSEDSNPAALQVGSISSVIHQDHRQIEDYYEKIVNSKDTDIQLRYQNAFVWALTRHAIAEELVVYPSIETGVNNGKIMVDKDRAEHQVTKEQLYKFQNMTPRDAGFIPTLESLMKDLKMHIKEEEEHDLVKLEEALVPSRSKNLAHQFERAKTFIPTRSHPSAPNKPPFETAVGLLTAPLDKIRDLFRSWPNDPGTRPPSAGSPGR